MVFVRLCQWGLVLLLGQFYGPVDYLQARQTAIDQFCGGVCAEGDTSWALNYEVDGSCSDPAYTTQTGCSDADKTWKADLSDDAKNVSLGGIPLGFASVAQYATTISVVIQLIVFITLGSFADYGSNRKRMFILSNSLGLLAVFLVVFMGADALYWVNSLLLIIAVVAFSLAQIFYNAYLPLLVNTLPEILAAKLKGIPASEILTMEQEQTHKMSLKGLASGFSGQLLFLVANLGILMMVSSENYLNTRVSVFASGIWILFFSSITFHRLKIRPSPPLPADKSYCSQSLTGFYHTCKSFAALPQLGRFLVSYFVFSDGTSTLAASAAVFAQEELAMTPFEIGLGLVETSIAALVGCMVFKKIHECGVSAKAILAMNLAMMGLIPIYGLFFLTSKWEWYFVALIFGFNTGSQQTFTRSIFAHALPSGREAEYFSLFEISDRGTAWLGPLVVGIVNQQTGSYRDAFSTLVMFFVVGIALLWRYDPVQAEIEKIAFDKLNKEDYKHEA